MIRIVDIALKDLLQLGRDFKTFMFLLVMPIVFTFLFGYAFGGFGGGGPSDPRLPVGYLDQDGSRVSSQLHDLLAGSEIIRLVENAARTEAGLESLVAGEEIAAAVIVPPGYGKEALAGRTAALTLIADTGTSVGTSIEADVLSAASRLSSAVFTAISIEDLAGERMPFDYALQQAISAWEEPPIAVEETTSSMIVETSDSLMSLGHVAPGMMLQFAIAGLLTAAQIIVSERKTRSLQRLLTTATRRVHILFGHYLAIFALISTQFVMLLIFGQLILNIDYMRLPAATLAVALSAALCISAMGLLIGVLARSEEQAVSFSIIPMFVFAGLGGAWVPLEVTGPAFQAIGHISPVAWAMDGFKNITIRGFGFESVLAPAAALLAYAIVFFAIAAWRLSVSEER